MFTNITSYLAFYAFKCFYLLSSGRGMSQICFHFLHDTSHHLLEFCVVSAFLLQWTRKYNRVFAKSVFAIFNIIQGF